MDKPHHRRDFVRVLAFGAPALVLSEPGALADDPPKEAKKTEADARMELVLARFGKHLDEAARKSVRSEVEMIVRRAETLRKFELDNGDGPSPVFQPYRAPLT